MAPSRLSRYRAERLLRKDFAGLRTKVLAIVRGQLRAMGVALAAADLEACYAMAWHGLYATVLSGEQVENPSAWLVLVTFRRAIDEHRAAGRAGVVDVGGMGAFPWPSGAPANDLDSELEDRAYLRQVFEALRMRLSPRERQAASLCYLQGLSRAEAAQRMGISEARMRKLMEGAGAGRPGVAGKVGELLETIGSGAWCEQQSSLMRAYAFGILDPGGERHGLAAAHCRECPACRAHVATLRGLASVLPLPLLPALAGARGGTAAGRGAVAVRRAAGGWRALPGSLTAKLAATAIVFLAGGYAALGVHAHASPVGRRAHAAASALAPAPLFSALSRAPFAGAPRARVRHSVRKLTPGGTRRRPAPRVRAAPSSAEAPAREFGPERVPGVPPKQPAAATTTPSSAAAPGEFGLE